MRSIFLFFAGASQSQISNSLREFGALEQDGAPWIYPSQGDPILYINWQVDLNEYTESELDALGIMLGSKPEVELVVDVTGRVPGEAEVRAFAVHLLRAHRGAAQDDHTDHIWTIEEIEAGPIASGHRFFVGR